LFLFLPGVLLLYFTVGRWCRNALLLAASLLFYAWGEQEVVLIMLLSIAVNWAVGLGVDKTRESGIAKLLVALGVAFNVGMLVLFKYSNWLWATLGRAAETIGLTDGPAPPIAAVMSPLLRGAGLTDSPLAETWQVHLPIGISFFTFQAMSYVIDVYRRNGPVQRNPINFAVYISLFPQLIAGPIVRYRDIAAQILERVVTLEGFAEGVRRFVLGLGKKVLVANVVAVPVDRIFALPADQIDAPLAWLGIVCYAVQIYFDFSGYSDMAIGLGRMLGFRFLENFNYPYVSASITEFWRRWHISLSSWFRDYLYIPLGGNRHGRARTYSHLLTVFFLCGLWHGAAWSFIIWGLFHGLFLVIERMGLRELLGRMPRPMRHGYTLLVVLVGWVLFRAPDLPYALDYLGALFGLAPTGAGLTVHVGLHLDALVATALLAGMIGATPWLPRLLAWRATRPLGLRAGLDIVGVMLVMGVLLLSAMEMSASSYNPFIYFRF
jgi:alginate O-acetyltransferase complex protein AlgI